MLDIVRYTPDRKEEWNTFAATAKNGVFLFQRGYMDYHADRFEDHSLLLYHGRALAALLPANRKGDELVSHGGLTFGGLVTDARMTTPLMLTLFDDLMSYLSSHGFRRLVYKQVPAIYHRLPAAEDSYALFRHEAKLVRRDVTSTVQMQGRPEFQDRRRRAVRKALAGGVTVVASDDYAAFWGILEANLLKIHGAKPTHSLDEIRLLAGKFPQNICLVGAFREGEMLAGVVIYENETVAHAQYISSGEAGRTIGALDAVFDHLINVRYAGKTYFDFGISTVDGGRTLNQGLIEQKEGFGGRAVVHDWYEVAVAG
jgi:hypothetical protein